MIKYYISPFFVITIMKRIIILIFYLLQKYRNGSSKTVTAGNKPYTNSGIAIIPEGFVIVQRP